MCPKFRTGNTSSIVGILFLLYTKVQDGSWISLLLIQQRMRCGVKGIISIVHYLWQLKREEQLKL